MKAALQALLASWIVAALAVFALGQTQSDQPVRTARISGRIIDDAGKPISSQRVYFRSGPKPEFVDADSDGRFIFAAHRRIAYEMSLNVPLRPFPTTDFKGVGTVVIGADGLNVDMGNIVLRVSSQEKIGARVEGQIKVISSNGNPSSSQATKVTSIATLFIGCADSPEYCSGGTLHIIHGDGKEIQPPKEKIK